MNSAYFAPRRFSRLLAAFLPFLFLMVACAPPVKRPTGAAAEYEDTKDMFKRGRFDRALEFSDDLAAATPANAYTERACVLRAVVYTGYIKAHKELVDAYDKALEKTKNPRFQAEYGRQRHDNLQFGARAALGLGEVANKLTEGSKISKELILEASYPSVEGPVEVAQLERVKAGGWIEPEDQDAAVVDAQRKGIDDALGEAVGGDRAKAREVLAAGSFKINGVGFALFLGKQLLEGASLYDKKHGRDSQKFRLLCNVATQAAQAAVAGLKETPNPDKEKQVRNLQDKIKTALKKG
jgi:hypothetical protein